jgi:alginate O-acetyltransferase complex protein AlgI
MRDCEAKVAQFCSQRMLFNSLEFILLTSVTARLYYVPPLRRAQVAILIVASFGFYAYGQPGLLLLFMGSILVNAGEFPSDARSLKLRPTKLGFGWCRDQLDGVGTFQIRRIDRELVRFFGAGSRIGGSVVAGHAVAHRHIVLYFSRHQSAHRRLATRAEIALGRLRSDGGSMVNSPRANNLLWGIFPQLVAGPIGKAHDFIPQIEPQRWRDIEWDRVVEALVFGYFLKMVIADNMRDQTFWTIYPYFNFHATSTLVALLFGYSGQIFADFAGYSLIAIGVGRMFGYRLPMNFNFPHRARSLADFWRRWHISLSTWLREYLYIPLGGNRRGNGRTYFILILVMGLGGLWHGAAWSYLFWGLYQGVG